MNQIERNTVIDKLTAWQNGEVDAQGIWEWSLSTKEKGTPVDGAVQDVMDVLVALPQDLIIVDDAQVMLEALRNPVEELTESQNLVWNYFDFIDTEGRKQALADDPFYGDFCGQAY
jgi:hypothetical protein